MKSTVKIDKEILDAIKSICSNTKQTISGFIEIVLEKEIKRRNKNK